MPGERAQGDLVNDVPPTFEMTCQEK